MSTINIKPRVYRMYFREGCNASFRFPDDVKPDDYEISFDQIAVRTLPVKQIEEGTVFSRPDHTAFIATMQNGVWQVEKMVVTMHSTQHYFTMRCDEANDRTHIACPIDPRMTREDIAGAIHAFANDNNNGMLFAHATEEEHHDRILLAETAISTVFEEILMDRLIRMDVIDIAGRSTSNRRGELTILAHINSFRNDCMKLARYNEGQLHIGQHVKDPEEHHIYQMVENAYDLCVKKWKAEKSAEYNQISDRLKPIEKRLKSRHSFKRRWEIPRVFPNAPRDTDSDSDSDDS